MDYKNQEKFFVLKIIGFESGTTNSLNLEKDIVIDCQCVTKHP